MVAPSGNRSRSKIVRNICWTSTNNSVNLSACLESQTKVVKKPIVIDWSTGQALDGSIAVKPLDEEMFKGKTIPVKVYSVVTT